MFLLKCKVKGKIVVMKKNYTNPIEQEKLLNNFCRFFEKFNEFFENVRVDDIVNQEFTRQYELLPLLVKARMYYDEQ